eukprot:m.156348 g.156348  ORF g.156348 m.156348 type:complete len:658 (-) comp15098_c0_seq14:72-2045(-)
MNIYSISVVLAVYVVNSLASKTSVHVVSTPYGDVQGDAANETVFYRGIPYAAPPSGKNRFRPPQKPTAWSGVRMATDFGPSCLQRGSPQLGNGRSNYPGWPSINVSSSSEDCLFLNVYVPETIGSDPIPVMIYFHAGEFRYGSSNDMENDWPYFAHGKVILVTANVRLGVLGFAALDGLRSRDPNNSTGNYGMQDQRAVMEWVQESIKSFGGDKNRVTIFGESSGGSSVAYHLYSKRSVGLFHGAIMESPGLTQSKSWRAGTENTQFVLSALTAGNSSGCAWDDVSDISFLTYEGLSGRVSDESMILGTAKTVEDGQNDCAKMPSCFLLLEQKNMFGATEIQLVGGTTAGMMYEKFVSLMNYSVYDPSKADGIAAYVKVSSEAASVECLLQADAADLVAMNDGPPWGDTLLTDSIGPVEDGVELPAPLAVLTRGKPQSNVSVIAGSNLDEGTMFIGYTNPLDCNASKLGLSYWASIFYGESIGLKIPELYATVEQPTPLCDSYHSSEGPPSAEWLGAMRSVGDYAILCRVRDMLNQVSSAGLSAHWYLFKATPIFSVNVSPRSMPHVGSFHGAEVPFVFGDSFELSSDGERKLSNTMGCYWTNFATTGDPNKGNNCSEPLPTWNTRTNGQFMSLSNTTINMEDDTRAARCNVLLPPL